MPSNPVEFQLPESLRAAVQATVSRRARSFIGTLVLVDGEVELFDPLTQATREATAGIRISRDVQVAVSSGRALIRMDDDSDIWVEQGSVLDLSHWRLKERHLFLRSGRLLALVAPLSRRYFRVSSPAGAVMVTGTAFELAVAPDSLLVSVMHGSVQVDNAHGQVTARRGMQVHATGACAPQQARNKMPMRLPDWAGDISVSGLNPAIRTAFRAISLSRASGAKQKNTNGNQTKEHEMKGAKRGLIVLAAVVALVGGGYRVRQHTNPPAALRSTTEKKSASKEMAHGGDTTKVPDRQMASGGDGPDGMKQTNLPGGGKSSEKTTGPRPLDVAAAGISLGAVHAQLDAGFSAIDALVQQGVSREEAEKRVSRSLTDSFTQQLSPHLGGEPVNVRVTQDRNIRVQVGAGPIDPRPKSEGPR